MGNANSGRRPRTHYGGIKPVPTAVKVLRGITRNGRINLQEPAMTAAAPDIETPPRELEGDAVATAEWARVVPLLRRAGVITQAERTALVTLCAEWSRWMAATLEIRKTGMLVPGRWGVPTRHPCIKIAHDSLSQLQRLWAELGLTPSARSRLTALPQAPAADASKWGDV